MDLYGKALLDYHNGLRDRVMMIRRDDGFMDEHGADLYFEPLPFPQEAEALAQATGPVLDIGCGAGRHLKWLQSLSPPQSAGGPVGGRDPDPA